MPPKKPCVIFLMKSIASSFGSFPFKHIPEKFTIYTWNSPPVTVECSFRNNLEPAIYRFFLVSFLSPTKKQFDHCDPYRILRSIMFHYFFFRILLQWFLLYLPIHGYKIYCTRRHDAIFAFSVLLCYRSVIQEFH